MQAPFDLELINYCNTEAQRQKLEKWAELGSQKDAAALLGCADSHIRRALRTAKKNAARQGYAPGHFSDGVAPGYRMGKVTIQRGPDGVERVWERQSPDDRHQEEAIKAALEVISEEVARLAPLPAPSSAESALLNVYTMTDCHIGMMAWREEGGSDWDLKIAEKTLTGCFEDMVSRSPNAETAIIAQLGDWLHYDSLQAVTPTSGHILDADGRFGKMVQVAIRVLRRLIDVALLKHKNVILLSAEGNHDIASSVWMRCLFAALYENEPRVQVIQSETPYYAYRHGDVMLGWHHGHMKKPEQLPLFMAAQFSKMWGDTTKRYAHLGDKHHLQEKEHSGMIVTQHPTLAARDAYASRHGWHALRTARSITYHERFGEVSRIVVNPEMLSA